MNVWTMWDTHPEDYETLKSIGINVVWNGDVDRCDALGLGCILDPAKKHDRVPFGYTLGDDIPIGKLREAEEQAKELRRDEVVVFPVLVSATYTRLLPYLEAETYSDYLDAFFDYAPSLTPMLCHYPAKDNDPMAPRGWRTDYWENLQMVADRAHRFNRPWWMWIQATAHSLYEWQHHDLGLYGIALQVQSAYYLGATGFGFFGWNDIEGNPGLWRDPDMVREAIGTVELL